MSLEKYKHHGVKLSVVELRVIADKLAALEETGIEVTEFKCGGVTVHVASYDDQRDGLKYYVTRVTSGSGLRSSINSDIEIHVDTPR